MADPASPPRLIRFGAFELDLRTGELRKHGRKLKLHGQPIEVLAMLLEHPGEVVTREELQKKLWPTDTFVDFDHSLNTAINKLRETLGDSADNPRFVETVPRRGYRFVATVEGLERPPKPRIRARYVWVAGLALLTLAVVVAWSNVGGLRDRVLGTAPTPKIQSIAVLPLKNLSGDPEQEYFADGMTDALITELGKISALRVISRTSVIQYKGAKKPLPGIARELNVEGIVEGAVLRSGDRVRINAQLVQANPEKHLWAASFERDLRDVLVLQGEVARAIAREIKIAVTPKEHARLASFRPVNVEAHEAFLRGQFHLNKVTEEGFQKAIPYFQQAIDIDPTYARAYLALSRVWIEQAVYGGDAPPNEALPKIKSAIAKALELDEGLAEAHAQLGMVKRTFEWDWPGAERELKRAIELNPNSFYARNRYSTYLTTVGRFQEAIEEDLRAFALNPVSRLHLSWTYFYARRYDDAIREMQRELETTRTPHVARTFLALYYYFKGRHAEALAECDNLGDARAEPFPASACGHVYGALGRRREAQKALEQLLSRRPYADAFFIAVIYAGVGEKDKVIHWLRKGYEDRNGSMWAINTFPGFDSLRSDPRFQDLLRRMNFSPYEQ